MIFNNNIIVTSVIIFLCVSQLFFIMILSMTRIVYRNPIVSYLTDSFVDDLFTKGAIFFFFNSVLILTNPFLCVLLDIYIVADEEENQLALKLHRFVTPE